MGGALPSPARPRPLHTSRVHPSQPTQVFSDDLFTLLGDARPDWRWLIAGPYKSGSGWHKARACEGLCGGCGVGMGVGPVLHYCSAHASARCRLW